MENLPLLREINKKLKSSNSPISRLIYYNSNQFVSLFINQAHVHFDLNTQTVCENLQTLLFTLLQNISTKSRSLPREVLSLKRMVDEIVQILYLRLISMIVIELRILGRSVDSSASLTTMRGLLPLLSEFFCWTVRNKVFGPVDGGVICDIVNNHVSLVKMAVKNKNDKIKKSCCSAIVSLLEVTQSRSDGAIYGAFRDLTLKLWGPNLDQMEEDLEVLISAIGIIADSPYTREEDKLRIITMANRGRTQMKKLRQSNSRANVTRFILALSELWICVRTTLLSYSVRLVALAKVVLSSPGLLSRPLLRSCGLNLSELCRLISLISPDTSSHVFDKFGQLIEDTTTTVLGVDARIHSQLVESTVEGWRYLISKISNILLSSSEFMECLDTTKNFISSDDCAKSEDLTKYCCYSLISLQLLPLGTSTPSIGWLVRFMSRQLLENVAKKENKLLSHNLDKMKLILNKLFS